jgi:predicted DNA-binding antitoxin AbrB/MazE fold protein
VTVTIECYKPPVSLDEGSFIEIIIINNNGLEDYDQWTKNKQNIVHDEFREIKGWVELNY